MERIPQERREEWVQDLRAPLPGAEKRKPTELEIEQEGADFMATMMMHQARKG